MDDMNNFLIPGSQHKSFNLGFFFLWIFWEMENLLHGFFDGRGGGLALREVLTPVE